ncbi:cyclic AMP-responsive element-binding protein 3-like protein 2 isoform X2 [Dendronephthya gigantea]|uniref:cyclic AMP-responsive element-binding protein 3-like protein 2 isoform X2 n=1 Tax=Dendronephthya gigantea TaxID=151771 RepID=UPI00106C2620|nr:cyclic AMP-responsive element-binding protein 3-like protein 2 isoform X2 [Dendronephthya gigantea]XP_028411471.1 cyclic AMP-responsive element-binding protein 3-like protein 2 isoform X2 [Dendronephthya gigantea]
MDFYEKKESARDAIEHDKVPGVDGVDVVAPLSKAEEFALKKVRRKLKNKISAQESRKRKKQHLESLEKRVRLLDSENSSLRTKLEKQNQSLRSLTFQLSKTGPRSKDEIVSYQNQGTQTGICLKCYLQKESVDSTLEDFKIETGKNGQIIVQSDFVENRPKRPSSIRNEYTEFSSIFHARSLRDKA